MGDAERLLQSDTPALCLSPLKRAGSESFMNTLAFIRSSVHPALERALFAAFASISSIAAAAELPRGVPVEPTREINQFFDRARGEAFERGLELERERARRAEKEVPSAPAAPKTPASGPVFTLRGVDHSPSAVLTEEDVQKAAAPWLGRKIRLSDVFELVETLNRRYLEKGCVVCRATVEPQRIQGGRIRITLTEGRTGSVAVKGNRTTKESFIRGAFSVEPGEVVDFRALTRDLTAFNLTHDAALTVDMHAGKEPGTTDYEITAHEPPPLRAGVFADTMGASDSGRVRAGADFTWASPFGRRDRLSLIALASRGAKSLSLAYMVPLTARGLSLGATVTGGSVNVVEGDAAALDISGRSFSSSLRLEDVFAAGTAGRASVFGEITQARSMTDMLGLRFHDERAFSQSLGLTGALFGRGWDAALTQAVHATRVKNRLQNDSSEYFRTTGTLFLEARPVQNFSFRFRGSWQAMLGGDSPASSDVFSLGASTYVRGYPNDTLTAEGGAAVSFELEWAGLEGRTPVMVFLDAGRLWGESEFARRSLASTGLTVTAPLWSGATLSAAAAVPLQRTPYAGADVPGARFDLVFSARW